MCRKRAGRLRRFMDKHTFDYCTCADPEEVHCKMCRMEEDDPVHGGTGATCTDANAKQEQIPDDLKAAYFTAKFQKNMWPREYVMRIIERIAIAEDRVRELEANLNKRESLLDKFTENNVRLQQQLEERDEEVINWMLGIAKDNIFADGRKAGLEEAAKICLDQCP